MPSLLALVLKCHDKTQTLLDHSRGQIDYVLTEHAAKVIQGLHPMIKQLAAALAIADAFVHSQRGCLLWESSADQVAEHKLGESRACTYGLLAYFLFHLQQVSVSMAHHVQGYQLQEL